MKKLYFIMLFSIAILCLFLSTSSHAAQVEKSLVGINLAPVEDWASQIIFIDAMKSARPWRTRNISKDTQDTGLISQIPLDVNGYPCAGIPYEINGVPQPQIVHTILLRGLNGQYPVGNYTVLYDGEGQLSFGYDAKGIVSQEPGKYVIEIVPADGGIHLTIESSSPSNPIRNIRVIMPGYENSYEQQIFYPSFIERLGNLSTIRFIKFQHIDEGNPTVAWQDRTTPAYYTQATDKGAALEYAIELANRAGKDAWLHIPHMADNDYVRNFAQMVKDKLSKNRKAYIEYSNELWNGALGFPQTQWVRDRGCELKIYGDGTQRFYSGIHFQAKRSAEIFKIFEDVFGEEKDRIVKVLATQAANISAGTALLYAFNLQESNGIPINTLPQVQADALAIAPYFGGYLGSPAEEARVSAMTLDDLFVELETVALPAAISNVQAYKDLVDRYGLALVGYEGGQHLAAQRTVRNNAYIVDLFIAANRDVHMERLYSLYLDAWFNTVGSNLINLFSYCMKYSNYGSFGILEYLGEPVEKAHKYRAVMTAADKYKIIVKINEPPELLPIGDKSVVAGRTLSFKLLATDPDNDPLIFSGRNLPLGASFDVATATFNWRPVIRQQGTYPSVEFEVSDGLAVDTEVINITVTESAIVSNAPTNLVATALSENAIQLTWADNSDIETGFKIERSAKPAGGFLQIGTVDTNTTSFVGTSLSSSKTYYYRVRAYNTRGNTIYSNTASATTLKK